MEEVIGLLEDILNEFGHKQEIQPQLMIQVHKMYVILADLEELGLSLVQQ